MADRTSLEVTDSLTGDQVAAIGSLVDRAARQDGFAALNEEAMLSLRHGDDLTHVLVHDGAGIVGYGQRQADGHSALLVAPDYRGRRLGSTLLRELGVQAVGPIRIWATGDSPAARRLAAGHGLRPVRRLLVMKRPLNEPLPDPPVPGGVRVRRFVVGSDEPAWLAVNARAFADHPEQGSVTADDLARRIAEPWFDPAGFLVAEREDVMVGFHWTKQHPDRLGEVYVLGVDPDVATRGLGRSLLAAGLRFLAGRGNTEVMLYVEGDNARALALYRGFGFEVASCDVLYAGTVPATRRG